MEQGSGSRAAPSFAQLPSIASNFGEILQDQHIFGGPSIMSSFGGQNNHFVGLKT